MKYFLHCALLLFTATSFAQTADKKPEASRKVKKYIDEVYWLIRNHALYSDSINWKDLDAKVKSLSRGMTEIEDCKPVIDTIMLTLRRTGDKHSLFVSKEKAKELTSNDPANTGEPIKGDYLGDNIGYIKVPEFQMMSRGPSQAFASELQDQIKKLDEKYTINNWIVDLRGNKGGNMHPMVKGLSCFIGDGIYGYIVKGRHAVALSNETVQDGIVIERYRTKNPDCKIAVLIDDGTGSSGELTAIAFKSRPNVRFFGQPSAGYTTSNSSFQLSDGAILLLAMAYMADANKKTYLPNIVPDVITPRKTNSSDPTVDAAKAWLRSE
jgi:carboxyl-terminal processing protease